MYWCEKTPELQYTAGSKLLTIINLENLNTQCNSYNMNRICIITWYFHDITLLFLLKHYFLTVKIHYSQTANVPSYQFCFKSNINIII